MPHFNYKAKRSSGEIYSGEQDAGDRYEVYKAVKQAGDEIISIDEHRKHSLAKMSISIPFLGNVKTQEKITFARNLGAMIEAGLAVSRALSVMERQTHNKELKKVLSALGDSISKGQTLADSMLAHKKVFSSIFVSMVRAGEQSGTLAGSLKVVALQMDRNYALTRRIRGAMMYPSIIFLAMILVGVLMMVFIVPTLMKTFTELNIALPLSTRIVLGISDAIRNHGILLLLGIIILIGGVYVWSKKDQGKKVLHLAILKIPVIGNIIKEVNTARTARTLASLLGSGVDVVEAIQITGEVIQNVHYRKVLLNAREVVQKGAPMSQVFNDNEKLYPIFIGAMMTVGEETGKMSEMLMNVAVFYEEDVEQKTKDMSTIIEPFLMVVIGAAVGFFAVAMISPMYSLVNVI